MPRKGKSKGSDLSTSSRLDVLCAPQYRCSIGGEWKPGSNFSRKNLNALESKVQRGQRVTPATTGMVCRDHSGEPKLELRCEGPCNKVKILSDFSKSSRTKNLNWCQACVRWQEVQEPQQATEEDDTVPGSVVSSNMFSISLDDGNAGRETTLASSRSATCSALPFGLLRPSDSNVASGRLLGAVSRASGPMPPHLGSFRSDSDGGVRLSETGAEEYYQPDDASICPDDSASQFAGSHGRHSRIRPDATRLTAGALHQRMEQPPKEETPAYFNSWDNSGRQHMERRNDRSESGSAQSFDTRELSTIFSEDDHTQTTISRTSYADGFSRTKKWGKIPRKLQPPPPIPEWDEDDVEFEDDGSEPELP